MELITLTEHADRSPVLRAMLESLVDDARDALGDDLIAVVLTGSLAKGEASTLTAPEGAFTLLSDLDLYLVCDSGPGADRSWLRGALDRQEFLHGGADVAFVDPGYFDRLGRTIRELQLLRCAKVLWQRPSWRGLPQPVAARGPGHGDDALELIQNRAGELLWLVGSGADRLATRIAYRTLRLWADAPLAYLAARGRPWLERGARDEAFALELAASGDPQRWKGTWEQIRTLRDQLLRGELVESRLLERIPELAGHGAWELLRLLYAATLDRCRRPRGQGELRAAAGAMDADRVLQASRDWLRRRPPLMRLREARRWAALAKSADPRWWRYGLDGVGPERVRAAAAGKVLFDDDRFLQILAGPLVAAGADHVASPAAVAKLWAEWMLGDRRS